MSSGERMKASFEPSEMPGGYASDAAGLINFSSVEEGDGVGRGYWMANDGRDNL